MALPLIDDPELDKDEHIMTSFAAEVHEWLLTFSSFSMRGFPPWPESESEEMSLRERSRGRRGGLEKCKKSGKPWRHGLKSAL